MRIMRLKDVMDTTGLGRSYIYKLIADGMFPKPVQLGARATGWVSDEVESWILEKIREGDSKEGGAFRILRFSVISNNLDIQDI